MWGFAIVIGRAFFVCCLFVCLFVRLLFVCFRFAINLCSFLFVSGTPKSPDKEDRKEEGE